MKDEGEFAYVMELGAKDELSDYVGYWIAVIDGKVVAKEKDAKTAYLKSKNLYPDKVPFVMKVPTESIMLL